MQKFFEYFWKSYGTNIYKAGSACWFRIFNIDTMNQNIEICL